MKSLGKAVRVKRTLRDFSAVKGRALQPCGRQTSCGSHWKQQTSKKTLAKIQAGDDGVLGQQCGISAVKNRPDSSTLLLEEGTPVWMQDMGERERGWGDLEDRGWSCSQEEVGITVARAGSWGNRNF